MSENVILVGISNTNNQNTINNFIEENGLTYPILFDTGSPGGVQGGDVYNMYYMPNDGSPYPRDFIIDQNGVIAYANNEIDTAWMLSVINELISNDSSYLGDINEDLIINILDVVLLVNFILSNEIPTDSQFFAADVNSDNIINILDVVLIVNIKSNFVN